MPCRMYVIVFPLCSNPITKSSCVWIIQGYVNKDGFAFLLYIAEERFFEKSFQSIPIFGTRMAIGFYNQRIIFDSHIKLADYMEGPTLLISDIVFSLGYEVDL